MEPEGVRTIGSDAGAVMALQRQSELKGFLTFLSLNNSNRIFSLYICKYRHVAMEPY